MLASTGASVLAVGLMFFGLIGSILPVVPGPLLIWLGALVWAWGNDFQAVGWPTLLFLGVMTLLAWASDLLLTAFFARRTGVSWKAVVGAVLGGLAGGLLMGGWIPILGTVLATVVGGVAGILLVESLDKRDLHRGARAGRGYIVGFLASSILEATLAVLMILLFVWQAYLAAP